MTKNYFIDGIKDSSIFGVSFIFLYLSIGANAFENSLSFFESLSTTLFVFSTPLQFLLVQSYYDGYILIPLILAMNARFLLMSATLAPYLKRTNLFWLSLSSILICPSVFSGCISKFKQMNESPFAYFLGLGLPIWLVSLICTGIGYSTGAALSSPELKQIVSLVLPLQFTGLAAKHYPNLKEVGSYFWGFILAPFMIAFSPKFYLLILPFVIGFAMLVYDEAQRRSAIRGQR
ncbi:MULTISPECIES: AzlC family ABC transporter permease [Helicobacter]|uniref:Branched-chain amino acid ABC transporter permease n=3 Tax=Helicobacter TaxID=209 RepID=A0A3D8IAQ3_9HELI|nr:MULTISPECIES: AzlC family ABC transporter permease [Helicobacter]RDU62026.1 branched-chain amino acid ABC transporter permease [Helicobacter ganmani]